MPSGKQNFTHIKDKKIAIYKSTTTIVPPGIEKTIRALIGGGKLWASYRSLSGDEQNGARMAGFTEDVLFVVNWRSDLEQGVHVVYREKVYEVTRVDDLEGYKKDMKLTCKLLPQAEPSDYPPV